MTLIEQTEKNLSANPVPLPPLEPPSDLSKMEKVKLYIKAAYQYSSKAWRRHHAEKLIASFSESGRFGRLSFNFPNNGRSVLESKTGRDLSDYYYINSYTSIINERELTVPTGWNENGKRRRLMLEILNRVFAPFPKEHRTEPGTIPVFRVTIPKSYEENYAFFINNKDWFQESGQDGFLFDTINQFFKMTLYKKDSNFSPYKVLETAAPEGWLNYVEVHDRLVQFRTDQPALDALEGLSHLMRAFMDLFTVSELIDLYRKDIQMPNIDEEKESFRLLLENRRVTIEEVGHKGAKSKAKKQGMTHFFLPFNEEAIPAGIPFSLRMDLTPHKKISNVWEVLPPTDGYSLILPYVGHNKDFPSLTIKQEPHLLGEEMLKAKWSDDFYDILVEEYDWPHQAEARATLDLIKEFPRLKHDLRTLGKEITDDSNTN